MNKLYNERVRQAISDEYVSAAKRREDALVRHNRILERLDTERNTLPYSQFRELLATHGAIINELHDLEIEISTWDKAREICLNVAEDMSKRRKE